MSLVENQNILNTLPNGEFGIFLKDLILKIERAAGEMVYLRRVLLALAEDPGAFLSTCSLPLTFACNCSSRGSDAPYWLLCAPAQV